jgi:hypothetical protein
MKSRKLVIIDPSFDGDFNGHYSSYDLAFARAAKQERYHVVIYGSLVINKLDYFEGIEFVPHFSADIWGKSYEQPDLSQEAAKQVRLNEMLDLARIEGDEISSKELFMPNITDFDFGPLIGFFEIVPHVKMTILFRYHMPIYAKLKETAYFARFKKLVELGKLTPLSDSPSLAKKLDDLFELKNFQVLPPPLLYSQAETSFKIDKSSRPLRFGTLGNARAEKGFNLISSLALRTYRNLKFSLQINDPALDVRTQISRLKKKNLDNVELIDMSLDDSGYKSRIESLDVVLAPYDPSIYSDRTSSVLIESRQFSKPILVTAGTWMADQIQRYGGGIVISEWSLKKLSKGIKQLFENYLSFKSQASLAKIASARSSDPKELFKLLRSFMSNSMIKHALILYPWSASQLYSSGAGKAVISLESKLIQEGFAVQIICGGKSTVRKTMNGSRVFNVYMRNLQSTGNLHLDFHNSSIENSQESSLREMFARAHIVMFEGTQLVLPIKRLLWDLDSSDWSVTTHDFLIEKNDESLTTKLLEVQLKSLQVGKAFALTEQEASIWTSLGIMCDSRPPVLEKSIEGTHPSFRKNIFKNLIRAKNQDTKIVFFVGSDYLPNHKALIHIKLLAEYAEKTSVNILFVVAGSVTKPSNSDYLLCLGEISDLTLGVLYEFCDAFFCPIEEGTGISIKAAEARLYESPILSTLLGIRGIPDIDSASNVQILKDLENHSEILRQISQIPIRPGRRSLMDSAEMEIVDVKDATSSIYDFMKMFSSLLDLHSTEEAYEVLGSLNKLELDIQQRILLTFVDWCFRNETFRIYTENYLRINFQEISTYEENLSHGLLTPISGHWIYEELDMVRNFIPQQYLYKYDVFIQNHVITQSQKLDTARFLKSYGRSNQGVMFIDILKKVVPINILKSVADYVGLEKRNIIIGLLHRKVKPQFLLNVMSKIKNSFF